ncbi:MAG TPA: hypothetical protein VIR32_04750 [Lachnospiraceae bacterium]
MLNAKKLIIVFTLILLLLSIGGGIYFQIEDRKMRQMEEEKSKAAEVWHEDLKQRIEENNKKDLETNIGDVGEEDWKNYAEGNFDKIAPENLKIIQEILSLDE